MSKRLNFEISGFLKNVYGIQKMKASYGQIKNINLKKTYVMKTFKKLVVIIFGIIAITAKSQSTGSIKGTVTNEKNEPMPFVAIGLLEDSTIIKSSQTDINGDFTFRQITPGKYTVRIQMMGYKTRNVKGVEVFSGDIAYVYKTLKENLDTLNAVEVFEFWDRPIIESMFTSVKAIRIDQIERNALQKNDIIGIVTSLSPSVIPTNDGKDIYVRGSRRGTTAYYIDGNKAFGPEMTAGMGIASMEVITGGVPAEYGDATGGFVIVNTKDYLWEMRRNNVKNENKKHSEEKKSTPISGDDDN